MIFGEEGMRFNGFVTRRATIRVVTHDPNGPPFVEMERNIPRWETWEVPDSPESPGPGRPPGPPFVDRADCLAYLRRKAALLMKDDQPVTLGRVGLLARGDKGLTTEDPKHAATTVRRWCQQLRIDFTRDVKKYCAP
jgi:hypothetical protein